MRECGGVGAARVSSRVRLTGLLDRVTLFCMDVIRIEKWGSEWRLIAFKGRRFDEGELPPPPMVAEEKGDEGEFWERRWEEEEEKEEGRFLSSIIRARSRVRELAFCQTWDYFVTLTMSPEKCDRFDLKQWVKDLGYWIGNYNRKFGCRLQYLLIPEQHKDGAWHAHGLLRGVAAESVRVNEHGFLDIPYYRTRFGFINMSRIRDNKRTASYITKYISKSSESTAHVLEKGAHLFYASRGLAGREFIWQGWGSFEGGFENAWCKVKFTTFEEAARIMKEAISYGNQEGQQILSNRGRHEKRIASAVGTAGGEGDGRLERIQGGVERVETCEEVRGALSGADIKADNGGGRNLPRVLPDGLTPDELAQCREAHYRLLKIRQQDKVAISTSPRRAKDWTTPAFEDYGTQLTFFGM